MRGGFRQAFGTKERYDDIGKENDVDFVSGEERIEDQGASKLPGQEEKAPEVRA